MNENQKPDEKKPVKNAVDLQKLRLDKLFKNIDRPVHLPEASKSRTFSAAPEFVRNVMGSSAGAGSGEFHVYRHIRRRENARQKFIAEEADKEDKDIAYQKKMEDNKVWTEERTAKKRAKRQKKKARQQSKGKRPRVAAVAPEEGDDTSDSEEQDSDAARASGHAGGSVSEAGKGPVDSVPEANASSCDGVPEDGSGDYDRPKANTGSCYSVSEVKSGCYDSDPQAASESKAG
ncbi:PRKR-interacting protein 1 homolog isoform X1 [Pollicipes pollicipes]|uniref:PRKR-interacting protein 1 homolog isoform X1 n=2 Tax=Pollicipes pollicipes TaxID=41117 RepID=UPI00188596EC|nr:PRKR-interacting protein 1 homolog isoform X1 [Pollicipes pollicipes]XP_037091451.1 PRKR-interacting protein 1 homolog isoform X1 [Pollicipes pollicipes]